MRDERGRPVNPRSPAMLAEMFAYADELAEHKRRHPADDVMTALVEARVDGERLDDAELSMFFFLLTSPATTRCAPPCPAASWRWSSTPRQYRRLREDRRCCPARSRRCSGGTRRS